MSTHVIVEQAEDVLGGAWMEPGSAPEGMTEIVITNEGGTKGGGSGTYC